MPAPFIGLKPTILEDPIYVPAFLSCRCLDLLLFGFFGKNRSAKRPRRPNASPAHANRQRNSDRVRLRKQPLGRAACRGQRETSDEFSGTNCEPTLLA